MTCDRTTDMMGCEAGYNQYYNDCCMTKGWVIGLWSLFALIWVLIITYALCRSRRRATLRNEMLISETTRSLKHGLYAGNYYEGSTQYGAI